MHRIIIYIRYFKISDFVDMMFFTMSVLSNYEKFEFYLRKTSSKKNSGPKSLKSLLQPVKTQPYICFSMNSMLGAGSIGCSAPPVQTEPYRFLEDRGGGVERMRNEFAAFRVTRCHNHPTHRKNSQINIEKKNQRESIRF